MNELQEIDVFIAPDGTVKLQVRGVKGPACLDITQGLEALLGGQVTERIHTDEFNQVAQEEQTRLEQRSP